ncbi:MAG TPA: glycosyltransferase [Bacteroidales bacterium]|nr:glycosyltransferase [Bacteroidales bacterium]
MSQEPQGKLVSIVIPVFNGSDYLGEAIDSALAQSWPQVEVIVVDDGSTDDTGEICRRYGERIRYFRKENGGQSSALNYGIERMQGDWFSWLSHDDLYFPEKIARQMQVALRNPGVVVYSDWMTVGAGGEPLGSIRIRQADALRFRYRLITENPYHGCSMLVPSSAFRQAGVFDTGIPLTSDVDLWFRMAATIPFVHVPEVLVKGRVHARQVSVKRYRAHQEESDRFYRGCLQQMSDQEILDAGGDPGLREAFARLAFNFARREYRQAALAALERMGSSGAGALALGGAHIRAYVLFQKKHWKNRIKYGWLKGKRIV